MRKYRKRIADDILKRKLAGDYPYRRKDGVYVVPVGCLKD